MTASAWSGCLLPAHEEAPAIESDFPCGALAVGAAAAAEPYRAALRLVAARTGCRVPQPSQLVPAERSLIRLAPADTPIPSAELGAVDFVSGGAITTAALHALYRIPGTTAMVRVWEPQLLDPTNLNRYVLMRRSMIGVPKALALKSWAPASVNVEALERLVDEAAIKEIGQWAPYVLVGTDNLPARWLVQSTWPQWLGVAGTAGFMVLVSEHERHQPCAGCIHAWTEDVPGDIPTVSFVSYWAGLLLAARMLRRQVVGPISLQGK